MDKSYVQQYAHLERSHWWFRSRAKIISKILRTYIQGTRLSVLNIGAAGGESSSWLSRFGNVISVEHEKDFLFLLRERGHEVIEASVLQLPFQNESFDLVCAFDVLEHVDDDAKAMKEIKRVCKTGGYICLTVPADRKLWSAHDVVNKHFRRYQKADFKALGKSLHPLYNSYFNCFLYLPVWIARGWSNRMKISDRSDFETFKSGSLSNKLFGSIFSFEARLMPAIRFPFGVSLFGLWKK